MKTAVLGIILLAMGVLAIPTGVLPVSEAWVVADRVWPILLFVVAITVVTELAAEAGLFTVVGQRLARWGVNRAWLLWLFVVALATLSTIFLSLDTTAVLLTPIVVTVARNASLPPLPFAMTTIWLANSASLLLPVSNLTNLLAEHQLASGRFGGSAGFAALMAAPAVICIALPSALLFTIYRQPLLRRYNPGVAGAPPDRVLLVVSAGVIVALLPALVSGVPVWIPAVIGATVLVVVFTVRRPSVLRFSLVPWQIVVFASGLFLVVQAAGGLGLTVLLHSLVGTGDTAGALLRLAGVATVGANVVNNLPAYLALEPVAATPLRVGALLIGVNAGPLILPWASLATLLWHERLVALDIRVSWRRYVGLGILVVPVTVVTAVLVLRAAH